MNSSKLNQEVSKNQPKIRTYKTLKRSPFSKIIDDSKTIQIFNSKGNETPKKSDEGGNSSVTFSSVNYSSIPGRLTDNNSIKNKNLTLLSSKSLNFKNSLINSGDKSNFFTRKRMNETKLSIKKIEETTPPVSHSETKECETDNSADKIEINKFIQMKENEISFRNDQTKTNNAEENGKIISEKENSVLNPADNGNESSPPNLDPDNLELVYQNQEENSNSNKQPNIRSQITEEKVISIEIIPPKLDLKKVKILLENILQENQGRNNSITTESNLDSPKFKHTQGFISHRISKNEKMMQDIKELYNDNRIRINKTAKHESFDEESAKCLANSRCSII